MLEQRIALVSKNTQMLRFLELTCRMHGFSVDRFSSMPPVTTTYFLIFWDADSVPMSRSSLLNLITISSRGGNGDRRLSAPISVAKLERLLFRSFEKDDSLNEAEDAYQTISLYNADNLQVLFADRILTLSDYEMRLLKKLCAARGNAVSREELNVLLHATESNMVDVYIHHLRKKLGAACDRTIIHTVRGIGYRTDLVFVE